IRSIAWPNIEPTPTAIGVAAGAAAGWLWWLTTGRRYTLRAVLLFWLAVGWLFGAWLAADFIGSKTQVMTAGVILGLLGGAWMGSVPYPSDITRARIAAESRKFIFLVPGLLFIVATLLAPLARTIWLGFLTGPTTELRWAGLKNYIDIFTDPGIIDFSNWRALFTSQMFWAAVVLAIIGAGVALWQGRAGGSGTGAGFQLNAATTLTFGGAVTLAGFAIFVVIRGTIANNLWWIFAVTLFSVSVGLAIAVLADRARGENLAKSLIFLPMSISFVGASIIWRGPMYIARPPQGDQTGIMNAIWVQIGMWSHSPVPSLIISGVLGLVILGLAYLAWRGYQAGSNGLVAGSLSLMVPLVWLIYRFLGPGIGGVKINEVSGELIADPILFLPTSPWNNWWMMVVLIWIQTGFAMVIFSAAIKAVPEELLEAARIDGATESQTFWRVTVPQISPTIGVVTTTLIVTVLRVFDIPKVMTNGNFDTQVLANEMWQRAFTELNFGLGSALAVVLFLGVLPFMYLNIRRMQKERLG
ncbi:MAG TPA: sugar ABC transporter permease, partial [Acidimicrobiia bacterium]|nr:sugar ABC transporter permease [Acidimicrobiia bacterium]